MLSKYVDLNSLKQYYNAYVLPTFDYVCLIWGHCKSSHTDRITKLQKSLLELFSKQIL